MWGETTDELTTMATTGATTLVRLMVSDGWGQTKARLGRFLARDADEDQIESELKESRTELELAQQVGDQEKVDDVARDLAPVAATSTSLGPAGRGGAEGTARRGETVPS